MAIDLSAVSDDGLTLILLRVPIKDLIGKCTQVSPQWNRILSESFFWRQKMEYDGYHLEWPKLVGLSTRAFQTLALKHCFNRNFLNDSWDFELQNIESLTLDSRWEASKIKKDDNDISLFARIENPPLFLDGEPKIPPGLENPTACIAIGYRKFKKHMIIKLSDEGLTDEIMDNFRPTIVVTEMIANRRDCNSLYEMFCSLENSIDDEDADPYDNFQDAIPNEDQREYREERRDENDQWVGVLITIEFKHSEAEGWHLVEIVFKDYPIGMRYLTLDCIGMGSPRNMNGLYGLKLANCSVKALCEKNAAK